MFAKTYLALGAICISVYATTIAMGWEYGATKVRKTTPTQRRYANNRSHRSHGFFGTSSYGGGK